MTIHAEAPMTTQAPMTTDTVTDPAFSIENATIDYTPAGSATYSGLRDLSLSGQRGEMLVLVGHSGCGKTTALNIIGGLTQPTTGDVSVLGTGPAKARKDMSYMFARDALYPWRTAVRNVEMGMELAGIAKAERRERALDMLDRVGLKAQADRYPWQLSQGMRQRVALARTWVTKPALILMDEPFAALDAQTRDVVRDEFLRIWSEERQTVVFVTHDLTEALHIADRIVALNEGEIVLDKRIDIERPRDEGGRNASPEYNALLAELRATLH